MTWRIWSPVGSTSSSNAFFETGFSSGGASALDDKEKRKRLRSGRPPARPDRAPLVKVPNEVPN